ncbi:hypothetical protein ACFLTU_02720 [Bacteroidota bacterium]
MKIRIKLTLAILVVGFLVFMSSCVGTYNTKSSRTASFYPNLVWYELSSDDMQFLGEMEISISYRKYLGIFRVYENINGEAVNRRIVNTLTLYGDKNVPLSPVLRRALYDVHVQYPEADFLIPVFEIEQLQTMFMGRRVEKRAKIRAYKLLI